MRTVKIIIKNKSFLLPESHSDNYEFPTYINENKENIIKCIDAYDDWLPNPLKDMGKIPDMSEFKAKTGIIGIPFNLHDVDLYILDRKVDVVMEVTL